MAAGGFDCARLCRVIVGVDVINITKRDTDGVGGQRRGNTGEELLSHRPGSMGCVFVSLFCSQRLPSPSSCRHCTGFKWAQTSGRLEALEKMATTGTGRGGGAQFYTRLGAQRRQAAKCSSGSYRAGRGERRPELKLAGRLSNWKELVGRNESGV